MSSSGVSFFRKGKSVTTSMWNANKKPEVSLTPREHFTIEDSEQEMLPLNMPCQGVRIEVHRVIVGPKPWPPLLQFSTYNDCCQTYFWSFFFCFWFLAIIGCYVLILCVNLGYGEPYTELQGVRLRHFNLSRTKTAWELDSDLIVVFKAGNPSKIAGFTIRFFHTEVEASYHDALSLGSNSSIPAFTQKRKSGRNWTTEVQSNHHELGEAFAVALMMQENNNITGIRDVRITVNAHAKQKYLARTLDRWFNLTCLVDMTVPSGAEPGYVLRKRCTQTSTEPHFIGYLCAPFMCMDF